MKNSLLICLLLISQVLVSQTLEELKKKAEKENTAKSWSDLTKYYFDNNVDTTLISSSVQKTYTLALEEENNEEIGIALSIMAWLYYTDDFPKYIETLEKALEYYRLTNRLDLQGEAINNIGSTYNQMGRYDEAIEQFHLAISTDSESEDENIHNLYNISYSYLQKGNMDSTKHYLNRALYLAEVAQDTLILIEGNTIMGIISKRYGDYDKAIAYYDKVLELHKQSNNKEGVSIVQMNIAVIYHEWKAFDKALYFARESVKSAYKYSTPDFNLGRILSSYGTILQNNNLHQQALDSLRVALPLLKDSDYETYCANISTSSSHAFFQEYDSCLIYLDRAENVLLRNKNLPAWRFYMNKGSLFVRLEKYKEAIPLLEAYVDILDNRDTKQSEQEYKIYNNLAIAYEKGTKDYAKALFYKNIAYNVRDSLYKESNSKTLSDYYTRYETAHKDLEISKLNEREQKLLYARTLFIAVSVIVATLLLLAVLYFRFKKQQKEKEAILKDKRLEEKEHQYQVLLKEMETIQMRRYLDGLESERSRLAKELHDNVANELYITALEMEKSSNVVSTITDRMKNLHGQIRSISHDLMPPQFQYASLLDIVYNHMIVIEKHSEIHFQLNIENESAFDTISASLAHEIYRIIQECTGNIIKHSSAKNATISLALVDYNIKLTIEDDGIGFDTSTIQRGIGLHVIRERSSSLGGSLNIESEVSNGCKISVFIPASDSEK